MEKAYELAQFINDPELKYDALISIAYTYAQASNYDQAIINLVDDPDLRLVFAVNVLLNLASK